MFAEEEYNSITLCIGITEVPEPSFLWSQKAMVPQNGFSVVQKKRVKIQLIRWRDKKGKEFDQYWIKCFTQLV